MSDHLSYEQLEQKLPCILDAPKDSGELMLIATRPASGQRTLHDTIELSVEKDVTGDKWDHDCWLMLTDGQPDPQVQVTIINTRSIHTIAQQNDRWALCRR